jgi:hypothetical protein
MLTIQDRSPRLCDGISRRHLLQAGGLSALGFSLAGAASLQASVIHPSGGKAKRCIAIFLLGGPTQHSTWDPKPQAPAEVRGEFGPIATNVPGIHISELFERTARHMDKIAILRGMSTGDNAHSSSGYYVLTGVPHVPKNRENANPGAPNDWPTMSAVVQHLAQGKRLLPPSIRLPMHIFNTDGSVWPGQDSGWLGHRADPWLFNCEPASPDFDIPQFRLSADVPLDRLNQRRSLLSQLESQLKTAEQSRTVHTFDDQQQQVFELLSSVKARNACDLNQEADEHRDRYGRSQFGQSVLLARRLIEADVKFVHVNWFRGPEEPSNAPCWDSHAKETERLKTVLVPPLDQAYSALLTDLEDRGLLEETLVLCLAEFGRTPKLAANGGRGHWGHAFSVTLAGGGIQGGQVYGASDEQGGYVADGLVRPEDLTATVFHTLGYAPETKLRDPFNRPLPISRGKVIDAIV